MGLSGHLHDVSGDSIPLLLLAAVAASISYLRSLLLRLVSASGGVDVANASGLGSGLAGLVVLADHLAANPSFPFAFPDASPEAAGKEGGKRPPRPKCVVCLCGLRDGDRVRRLPCCHLFHSECIDGWLHQLNLSCPLCRSPISPPELRSACDRRIGSELLTWLSSH